MPEKYTFSKRLEAGREGEKKKREKQAATLALERVRRDNLRRREQERLSNLALAKKHAETIASFESSIDAGENIYQLARELSAPGLRRELDLDDKAKIAKVTYTIEIGRPFRGIVQRIEEEQRRVKETYVYQTPNVRMQNQITLEFICDSNELIGFVGSYSTYVRARDESVEQPVKKQKIYGHWTHRTEEDFFPRRDSPEDTRIKFIEQLYHYIRIMKKCRVLQNIN